MRSAQLLGLAAAAAAFVIPEQHVFEQVQADTEPETSAFEHHCFEYQDLKTGLDSALKGVRDGLRGTADEARDLINPALESVEHTVNDALAEANPFDDDQGPQDPSHLTAWQLISESKYTTKFAKLVDGVDEVRDLLNKTDAGITVFVPSDKAFERIPEHHKKPPKEFIEALLRYHIVPDAYSARDIFHATTLPTALRGDRLSRDGDETPQRLSVKPGWRGLYLNNYNRITHKDIHVANGILHAVDTFNVPPPGLWHLINLFPTAFSTFELGLIVSRFDRVTNDTFFGATVFAPANTAWKKLGIKANAFLFSHHGHKYLRGLLAYHVVPNRTLYSDAFYGPDSDDAAAAVPKGRWHLDLPTLLHGKSVGVDVGRLGRLVDIHINHYSRAVYHDAIGRNGVLHVINRVLIPPHPKPEAAHAYDGGEMSVDELKQRLEPYVIDQDDDDDDEPCGETAGWGSLEL